MRTFGCCRYFSRAGQSLRRWKAFPFGVVQQGFRASMQKVAFGGSHRSLVGTEVDVLGHGSATFPLVSASLLSFALGCDTGLGASQEISGEWYLHSTRRVVGYEHQFGYDWFHFPL